MSGKLESDFLEKANEIKTIEIDRRRDLLSCKRYWTFGKIKIPMMASGQDVLELMDLPMQKTGLLALI